jgi:hypothetical protein
MAEVASALDALDGVTRVRRVDAARPGHSVVVAAARPSSVDPLLDELARFEILGSDTAGLGEAGAASGALGLLGANVGMMVLGASLTLLLQRRLRRGGGSPRSSEATG